MTSFLISDHSFHQKRVRFFHYFFISHRIKLKFETRIQNWMLILIFGSKSALGEDFGQYDTKTIILRRFLAKHLLEIALPWQLLRFQVIKNYMKGCVIR